MQPRVISITVLKIPCWKLTGQVQHLCKHMECGVKDVGFQSNDGVYVRQHIQDSLQGDKAVPYG